MSMLRTPVVNDCTTLPWATCSPALWQAAEGDAHSPWRVQDWSICSCPDTLDMKVEERRAGLHDGVVKTCDVSDNDENTRKGRGVASLLAPAREGWVRDGGTAPELAVFAAALMAAKWGADGAYFVTRSSGWPGYAATVQLWANRRCLASVTWNTYAADGKAEVTLWAAAGKAKPAPYRMAPRNEAVLTAAKGGLSCPAGENTRYGGWILTPIDEARLALQGVEYTPGQEGGCLGYKGDTMGVGRHLSRLWAEGDDARFDDEAAAMGAVGW